MTGVEDCFYHEAICGDSSPREKKPTPAISQIPGWGSDISESSTTPNFGGRRIGLFEHDSDYVRLAKMGGRSNLLSHPDSANSNVRRERVAYAKPDWMVYEAFTPSPSRVHAPVHPDYMIYDRPVVSHSPGGGKPPWAEDGQSVFRREGEESVRSFKTSKIENVHKSGQKRLENLNANNNNNNNINDNTNEEEDFISPLKLNRRYAAPIRLGELESDFRSSRRSREEASTAAAAAAATALASEGYSPSSPSAPRRATPA